MSQALQQCVIVSINKIRKNLVCTNIYVTIHVCVTIILKRASVLLLRPFQVSPLQHLLLVGATTVNVLVGAHLPLPELPLNQIDDCM